MRLQVFRILQELDKMVWAEPHKVLPPLVCHLRYVSRFMVSSVSDDLSSPIGEKNSVFSSHNISVTVLLLTIVQTCIIICYCPVVVVRHPLAMSRSWLVVADPW